MIGWLRRRREERATRKHHNDLDYGCIYWWGDRHGSLAARCSICNPSGTFPLRQSGVRVHDCAYWYGDPRDAASRCPVCHPENAPKVPLI